MNKVTVSPENPKFRAGKQGENLITEVYFDISGFQTEFGPGNVHLMVHRKQDAEPYLAPITVEGNQAHWAMSATDLDQTGYGEAQLLYYAGEKLAKSTIYQFYVERSIGTRPADHPSPESPYLEKVAEQADRAARAAEDAAKNEARIDRRVQDFGRLVERAEHQTEEQTAIADRIREDTEEADRLNQATLESREAAETAAAQAAQAAGQAAEELIDDASDADDRTLSSQKIHENLATKVNKEGNWERIDTITTTEDVTEVSKSQEPDGTKYSFNRFVVKIQVPEQPDIAKNTQRILWDIWSGTHFIGEFPNLCYKSDPTSFYAYVFKDHGYVNGVCSDATRVGYSFRGSNRLGIPYRTLFRRDNVISDPFFNIKISEIEYKIPAGTTFEIWAVRT